MGEKSLDNTMKISAAVICFNEEDKIRRCLESLHELVDEIIVVDSYSTDKTKEICLSFPKVKFSENPFAGHIEQKNYALTLCQHDYILSLDADEALSDELKDSLMNLKIEGFFKDAYKFHRLTDYNGFWVRHCGWYPDTKLRLIKKGSASWQGKNPHDILIPNNNVEVGFLKADLLHYSYDSISDHINQTNKFTTIAAKAAFEAGTRSSLFKVISRPVLKFLKDYLLKGGILDGKYGLIICTINSLSAFLKYSKILELQNGKTID